MQSGMSPAPRREAVGVCLKWVHQAQFAGFYCADELGYYRNNGIDVKFRPGGVEQFGGVEFFAIGLVSSGSDDFGVAGADQILAARGFGTPIVAVAVIYRTSPVCYYALESSGIFKPEDFVGKRIAVRLGGNEEATYRALMKQAGVDTRDIIEVPIKYTMDPLFKGEVEAMPGYCHNEPILAAELGYRVNVIRPSDYGVDLYADTLFTTEKMIQDRSDLVERFVSSTLKGWNYAVEHPHDAVEFTLKRSDSLRREHELAMLEASIPLLKPDARPIGSMEERRWRDLADMLLSAGVLNSRQEVRNAFTSRFVERAQGT